MKAIFLILIFILPGALFSQVSPKFIPTFAIKYCHSGTGLLSARETAAFDLLITTYLHHHSWAEGGMNSWNTLKSYNPNFKIALYMMGPGEYNTSPWGSIGQGWDWMKENHGATTGDQQWTQSGHRFPYLACWPYPNERMMNIGNPDWQNYWIDTVYNDFWVLTPENSEGADAIFSDNTHYRVVRRNQWYDENHVGDPAFKDYPEHYADSSGIYDHEKWEAATRSFLKLASTALNNKQVPVKIIPNFGYMGYYPEFWHDLDSYSNPLFAAMEEYGFVSRSPTYSVKGWDKKVNTMKNLKNMAVLMTCKGDNVGLDKMDSVISAGNMGPATGWEALWYGMTSFLLALNEDKTNGYLTFTSWGNCEYQWLDEFDPQYLHLGNPLSEYEIINGVAFREYEDGWVVVNTPDNGNKTNLSVPSGLARVVTHANFKNTNESPLVSTFDINNFRGLILLKEGKKIGNGDNPTDVNKIDKAREALTVFPNPFQDKITLSSNKVLTKIVVYDILGKVILEKEAHSKSITIDLNEYNDIFYIIKVYAGEVQYSAKVVKMK